jgi:hypothetical protein
MTTTRRNISPQIGQLTREYRLEYGRLRVPIVLPAGLRVAFFPDPTGGRWCLDEFPLDIFPGSSIERWDAIHYGLTIPSELVAKT